VPGACSGIGTIAKVACERSPEKSCGISSITGRPLIVPASIRLTLYDEDGRWISEITMNEEEYTVLRDFFTKEDE
jgi:hypothetical protein